MVAKIRLKDRAQIEEEMHRLFSGFAQLRNRVLLNALNMWHPATDVFETEHEFCIICELAGVDKKDIAMRIDDNVVTITGVRREPKIKERGTFHNLEINYGPFERHIQLPRRFIGSEPKAGFSGGILTIRIPGASQNPPRNIEVEVE